MEHRYQQAGGVCIHYVESGTGPTILLLHGFPDYWYGWRKQIPALTAAGLRVIAVDLRGYNLSERPSGIAHYKLDTLAGDIAALIRELSAQPPIVAGHDWGGIIAWHLAMHHPQTIRSLIILNAPHPRAFERELKRISSQWLRSSYVAFFQLPKVPELLLSAHHFELLRRALRSGPAQSDEDVEQYLSVFKTPGALTAALNYYRAAIRHRPPRPQAIHCPTLVLWGRRDPFLSPRLSEGLQPWVPQLEVVQIAEAGHWLHVWHAQQVNQAMLAFVRRTGRDCTAR